jgi:hypothetical protein
MELKVDLIDVTWVGLYVRALHGNISLSSPFEVCVDYFISDLFESWQVLSLCLDEIAYG